METTIVYWGYNGLYFAGQQPGHQTREHQQNCAGGGGGGPWGSGARGQALQRRVSVPSSSRDNDNQFLQRFIKLCGRRLHIYIHAFRTRHCMSAAAPLAAFAAGSNICFAQPPHGHDPGSYEELARMAAANRIQRLGQYGQNSVAIAQGVAAGFGYNSSLASDESAHHGNLPESLNPTILYLNP